MVARPKAMIAGLAMILATLGAAAGSAWATPYTPADDSQVLATVPPGARHAEVATRAAASERIDVALPLARFYIKEARSTGDLRFLGYAEAVLTPWVGKSSTFPDALVLHATILQSRHDFGGALTVLKQALTLRPNDSQSLLTSAIVLRVLGRFDESMSACRRLAEHAEATVVTLCGEPVRGLTGALPDAYARLRNVPSQGMPNDERAWRDSELGEMAVRLGHEEEAEHWFKNGIQYSPEDFYIRAAYADLLIRQARFREVLSLLQGRESLEPLLLRISIAQKALHEPGLESSRARLGAAFTAEAQRGDGVHRREESRFLLDVQNDARAALRAAQSNWQVQHEVEDVLILIRAANAAGDSTGAAPALAFLREHHVEDVRIATALENRS